MSLNKSLRIEFFEAPAPIAGRETKFGGSPFWIATPQWPMSRSTGKPMVFLGQVAIDQDLFPGAWAEMAYVFMSDSPTADIWDPNSGENAVIPQPGSPPATVRFEQLREGPTIRKWDQAIATSSEGPAEFGTTLVPQAEPPYVSAPYEVMSKEDARDHIARLVGNKVGGSPVFPQQEEFPFSDWRLLLQLEQILLPFVADFAMGCCFVFSNATVSEARLVFQR